MHLDSPSLPAYHSPVPPAPPYAQLISPPSFLYCVILYIVYISSCVKREGGVANAEPALRPAPICPLFSPQHSHHVSKKCSPLSCGENYHRPPKKHDHHVSEQGTNKTTDCDGRRFRHTHPQVISLQGFWRTEDKIEIKMRPEIRTT